MKYTVNISKVAKEDLREIYKYIAYDLLSPQTALNQLERLEENLIVDIIRIIYGGRNIENIL